MSEPAAHGIPVAVTCRVLEIARQPHYRWLARPVGDAELVTLTARTRVTNLSPIGEADPSVAFPPWVGAPVGGRHFSELGRRVESLNGGSGGVGVGKVEVFLVLDEEVGDGVSCSPVVVVEQAARFQPS